MGAREIPSGLFLQLARSVHEVFQQTQVYRFVRREKLGMVVEKLTGLDGPYKTGFFEGLGQVAEIRYETGKTGNTSGEEPFHCWLFLRHLHSAVHLDLIRRDKDEQWNETLIPHQAVALALLFLCKACALAKVNSRTTVHAQHTAQPHLPPCLPQVMSIWKQLRPLLDLARL